MPHISKRKLMKEVESVLSDQLLTFLSTAKTKKEAKVLADELLTKTERLMLGKRLAIIVMLARGYSFSQIEETLMVSAQTIVRVWKEFVDGKHSKIVRYARAYTGHFKRNSFWGELNTILNAGLPPRGRGRHNAIRKRLDA